MLFQKKHKEPMLRGRKIETRRFTKQVVVGHVYIARTNYRKDSTFAKFQVTSAHQEKLGDITNGGAWREGYSSRQEYLDDFGKINKAPVDLNKLVWVIRFKVVERIGA
jgi:hypothetical protein